MRTENVSFGLVPGIMMLPHPALRSQERKPGSQETKVCLLGVAVVLFLLLGVLRTTRTEWKALQSEAWV